MASIAKAMAPTAAMAIITAITVSISHVLSGGITNGTGCVTVTVDCCWY